MKVVFVAFARPVVLGDGDGDVAMVEAGPRYILSGGDKGVHVMPSVGEPTEPGYWCVFVPYGNILQVTWGPE